MHSMNPVPPKDTRRPPQIDAGDEKPVVGTWTYLYTAVSDALSSVATKTTDVIKATVIYPEAQVERELKAAKESLDQVFGRDGKIVDGMIDYGINAVENWLLELPKDDMKRYAYETAVRFLGKKYIHSLAHMLISRTLRHLVEVYKSENTKAGQELNIASFSIFLVRKLNGYVEAVPKENRNDPTAFQAQADAFLKMILPNGVQDLPGGALLGNTYFTNIWDQIRKVTANSLMQYADIKDKFDQYSRDLEAVKFENATSIERKASEALFDNAWKKMFQYAQQSTLLRNELKTGLANTEVPEYMVDAFMARQLGDCERSAELKGFIKHLLNPILLRALSLPADEKGQTGIVRLLSDATQVFDSYAKKHENATVEESKQLKTYEQKLKAYDDEIEWLEKRVVEGKALLLEGEKAQMQGVVDSMSKMVGEQEKALAVKKKKRSTYFKTNAVTIKNLRQKTSFTYDTLVDDLLGVLGLGKELPNPVDMHPALRGFVDGMKRSAMPETARKAILDYKHYRAGLKEATEAETAKGKADETRADEFINELITIAQKGLGVPARQNQVMAYANLLFGNELGSRDSQLRLWFLSQIQEGAFSPLVITEMKAVLRPIVLRLLNNQEDRKAMPESKCLKVVCKALSSKLGPLLQAQVYGDERRPLMAPRTEELIQMLLEDYLYCAAQNLDRPVGSTAPALELLLKQLGLNLQDFMRTHLAELKEVVKSDETADVKQRKVEAIFTPLSLSLKEALVPEKVGDPYVEWMQEFTWMDTEQQAPRQRTSFAEDLLPEAMPFRSAILSQVDAGLKSGWDDNVPKLLTVVFFDTTKQIIATEEQRVDGKEKPIVEMSRLIAEQVAASLPANLIAGAPSTADLIYQNVLSQLNLIDSDIAPEDAKIFKRIVAEGLAEIFKCAAFETEGRTLLAKYIESLLTTLFVPLMKNIGAKEQGLTTGSLFVQVGTGVVQQLTSHLKGVREAMHESGASAAGDLKNIALLKGFEEAKAFHVQLAAQPMTAEENAEEQQITKEKEVNVQVVNTMRTRTKNQEKRVVALRKELQELKSVGERDDDAITQKRAEIDAAEQILGKFRADESVAKRAFLRQQVALLLRLAGINEAKDLPLPSIAQGYDFEYCKSDLFPMILEGVLDSALDPAKLNDILTGQIEAGMAQLKAGLKPPPPPSPLVASAAKALASPTMVARTADEEAFVQQFNELFGELLRCSSPVVMDTLIRMEDVISLRSIFPNFPRLQDLIGGRAGEMALEWMKSNQLQAVIGSVVESALPSMRLPEGKAGFEPSPYRVEEREELAYQAILTSEKQKAELPKKLNEYVTQLVYTALVTSISNAFTKLWNATVDRVCPEVLKDVFRAVGQKLKWAATCLGIAYLFGLFAEGVKKAVMKSIEKTVAFELRGVTNVTEFDINQSLVYGLIGSLVGSLEGAKNPAILPPPPNTAGNNQ